MSEIVAETKIPVGYAERQSSCPSKQALEMIVKKAE